MSRLVVITGAGGVLCSTIAKAYAKAGCSVALLDLNVENAAKVVDEITAAGGTAKAYGVNCLDKAGMQAVKEKINADMGKCDILINGAGGNNPKGTTSNDYFSMADMENPDVKSFFDLDGDGVDFVFKLNFLATFLTTQVFAKDMVEKGGNIVNISSMNAFKPLTRIPAYSGAKAAVSNFTEWLAVHFASAGIRVNAIAPGFFVTKQNYNLLYNSDGSETDRSKKILSNTPMRRFGKPEELLGTLMWLTDDTAASFVTGIVVPIDGGFSAYSGV